MNNKLHTKRITINNRLYQYDVTNPHLSLRLFDVEYLKKHRDAFSNITLIHDYNELPQIQGCMPDALKNAIDNKHLDLNVLDPVLCAKYFPNNKEIAEIVANPICDKLEECPASVSDTTEELFDTVEEMTDGEMIQPVKKKRKTQNVTNNVE